MKKKQVQDYLLHENAEMHDGIVELVHVGLASILKSVCDFV